MVSSEEISRRLEAKKRGQKISDVKKTPPVQSTNECPQCQTPNLPSAKFCVGCGAPLSSETTPGEENKSTPQSDPTTSTPTTVPESPTEDYKLCPSCNQKNKPDAKFCIICGHKFEDGAAEEKHIEPLMDVVGEKDTPIAESETVTPPTPDTAGEQDLTKAEPTENPDEKTSEDVIPEIKVSEQFKSDEVKSSEHVDAEAQPLKEPVAEVAKDEPSITQEESKISREETAPDEDPVLKIKKAKELLDIGAITQEEFDRIKNKYLDLI
jgi:hypothetical protein